MIDSAAVTDAPPVGRRKRARRKLTFDRISFFVADQVHWEFELEVEGQETELEIEMKWSHAPAS